MYDDKYDNPGELRQLPSCRFTALNTNGKLLQGFRWLDNTKYGRVVQNLRGHCWKLDNDGVMLFYAGDYPT